jgi:hypothetical protein
MSQRGIRQVLVDLTLQFGEDVQDRCVLGREGLKNLLEVVRELEQTTLRALDKGGVVVVQADGALVTAYNVDSYDRRRAGGR